jgi:hypothetical protein
MQSHFLPITPEYVSDTRQKPFPSPSVTHLPNSISAAFPAPAALCARLFRFYSHFKGFSYSLYILSLLRQIVNI